MVKLKPVPFPEGPAATRGSGSQAGSHKAHERQRQIGMPCRESGCLFSGLWKGKEKGRRAERERKRGEKREREREREREGEKWG